MSAFIDEQLVGPDRPQLISRASRRRGRLIRRFLAHRLAVVSVVFIVALIVIAVFAPVFAPRNPNGQLLLQKFSAHSGVLGTDEFGRDQLSRLIYGGRISLIAGLIAVGVAAGVGIPLGTLAGSSSRLMDAGLSRISDSLQCVPALILALTVVAVLGPGLVHAMIAVGIVTVPRFFRVARAAAVEVSRETFIEASRALGCTRTRIIARHIFPNIVPPLVVQLSLTFAAAVTAEASLSFLGIGVQPPTASWGSMLASASKYYDRAGYMIYAPGITIAVTVLAFMMVGEGLRQAFGTARIAGLEGG
jgi:peptide/nickel transport system permease protein